MTTRTEPIRGKVARIINAREVVLNIGQDQGVRVGMSFDILTPRGLDIRDPDTGENLGSFQRAKNRIRIIQTQDRLSLASTYRSKSVADALSKAFFGTSALHTATSRENRFETLRTGRDTWEDLPDDDSYVSEGDPVVQVFLDDEPE